MGILGAIWDMIKDVVQDIIGIRKEIKPVKELTTLEKIEPYYSAYEQFQKEYNKLQKTARRKKWYKFDNMVNELIDEFDYDYDMAVKELKYMLETDEIDLDEGYIDFLREHDTP